MGEVFKEKYLVEDGALEVVVVGVTCDVDFLYCYFLSAVNVVTDKYFAVDAFAQAVLCVVGVVADYFHYNFVHEGDVRF